MIRGRVWIQLPKVGASLTVKRRRRHHRRRHRLNFSREFSGVSGVVAAAVAEAADADVVVVAAVAGPQLGYRQPEVLRAVPTKLSASTTRTTASLPSLGTASTGTWRMAMMASAAGGAGHHCPAWAA